MSKLDPMGLEQGGAEADSGPMRNGPARGKAQRIGLFGIFGTGNFGNDGSLEAMVRFLRRALPEDDLLCVCTGPDGVKRALGVDAVPIYFQPAGQAGGRLVVLAKKVAGRAVMWLHAIRQLRRLKVIMVPGMGALDDFGVSPFGWPMDIMTWFLLARLMGVKIVLASVGAGPIHHPLSRFFFKTAARAAHYRSFRDEISRTYMAGLGLDVSRDRIVPDIAFSLPAPSNKATVGDPITVGVGVMTYYGWHKGPERVKGVYDNYIVKMAAYIRWLLDCGHRVRILIGDETDNIAAEDILAALRSWNADRVNASVIFSPAHGLGDVLQQMADIDVAVATRFHNVVCALKMGRPTISVGYQDKNDVLLEAMGLAAFCQHIERLDVDRLKAQTQQLLSGRAEYERKIREVRTRFESDLQGQESALIELVTGRAY